MLTNPAASGVSQGSERNERSLLTYSEFLQLRDQSTVFSAFMACQSQLERMNARVDGGMPEEIRTRMVSAEYLSGKAMARTGLRMMPTFPLPPLKFRTVSFPQSGFKAGISDAAFPVPWFAIALRASATIEYSPLCVGDRCAYKHLRASGFCRSTPGVLARGRVMLSRPVIT